MTLWAKFKLSNTYFTNPEALRSVDFAYVYGKGFYGQSIEWSPVFDMARKGEIVVGVPDNAEHGFGGGIKTVGWKELDSIFGVFNSEKFSACVNQRKCVLVASSTDLLGSTYSDIYTTKIVAEKRDYFNIPDDNKLCSLPK